MQRATPPGRTLAAIAVTLTAFVGLTASPASAHSKLTSTSPTDGATLEAPPAAVSFTFDEPLLAGTEAISVNDDSGNVIATEPASPDGSTISMPWPAQAASGTFQVAYRVVSGDGHPVTGAITITITGAGTASSGNAISTADNAIVADYEPVGQPRGIAVGLVVGTALAVLVLIVVAGVALARRRRRI